MLSGGAGLVNVIPASIQRAMAINPAPGSNFLDAEHVVFLMQENRSFDHTFGTLKGVRGFNDPRAITLPNKNLAWLQTDHNGDTYAPYRLNIKDTKATWMSALPHGWSDQADARNNGKYDGWLIHKQSPVRAYKHLPLTMGYYDRNDIPFYYALADAFTVCDHNFCSSLTGTTPNRLHFWTGTIRGKQSTEARANVWNDDVDYNNWADWKTFPEVLEDHGVNWRIYQNELSVGCGLNDEEDAWLANFTDNPIEWFSAFNVRMHKAHRVHVAKAIPVLKEKIADWENTLSKNPNDEKLADMLKDARETLKQYEEEIKVFTEEAYQKLSAREKSLHERAFSTNTGDKDYHSLETLNYKDGDEDRTINIPKGDLLYQFRKDVKAGKLPTVSWLVPPAAYSDHPGSPWYGAWYLSEVLDILTKNPEVWKKTIFILTYDENDGYFDHLSPFVANDPSNPKSGKSSAGIDTGLEYVTMAQEERDGRSKRRARQSPIGLGYRVPMVIASPWSRGGKVNSQVFDHTSSLQFLEKWLSHKLKKNVHTPNISDWRRTICGDLSSVFTPYNTSVPALPFHEKDAMIEQIYNAKFKALPAGQRKLSETEIAAINKAPHLHPLLPQQEKGIKPANAIPYELYAEANMENGQLNMQLTAANKAFGKASVGAPFSVYTPGKYEGEVCALRSYTVKAGDTLQDTWEVKSFENNNYLVRVYGPNGFFRQFQGNQNDPSLQVALQYQAARTGKHRLTGNVELVIENKGAQAQTIVITDNAYKNTGVARTVEAGARVVVLLNLEKSKHWYDFTVKVNGAAVYEKRYAGHVEVMAESFTDPYMGGIV